MQTRALSPSTSKSNLISSAIVSVLDELDGETAMDALKTRSLPAFLRPKPRPLSTEDDLQQLYAKVTNNDNKIKYYRCTHQKSDN